MRRFSAVVFCTALLAVAQAANATTITLSVGAGGSVVPPDYILGEVIPPEQNVPGGQVAKDMLMVNTLLPMALGASSLPGNEPWYYRSTTNFGALPNAVAAGSVPKTDNDIVNNDNGYLAFTLSGNYRYLVATWDGTNSGSQVWYIGSIAAGTELRIPFSVNNSGPGGHLAIDNKHDLTHYTLLNPFVATVDEGGSTFVLLATALLGIGLLLRTVGQARPSD
jgi:hypothetical protein